MDETKLAELIVEALNRASEMRASSAAEAAEAKRREETIRELLKLNNTLKETSKASKTFERILTGQTETYKNVDAELETLNEAYKDAATWAERSVIDQRRRDIESAKSAHNLSAAISNVSIGFIKLSTAVGTLAAGAAGDFVKGLQRGSSGIELSAGLMSAGVDAVNTGTQAAAGALGSLGQIASTSTNKHVKALGLAAQGAGIALGFIGNTSSKVAKFGIEVLSTELLKTADAFANTSSAGALFANGMSGLRNAATQAGLRIDQFANVISRQADNLAATGLGVGEAVKQIGKVGSVLKKEGIDIELLKLGFGFEEQSELVAEVMADMRRARDAAMLDPNKVAQNTREYAENLRVIASLTGQDARQKMNEARRITADTAFRIKLMEKEKQQPGILDQMQKALSVMPPTLQTAIKQLSTFGAVSDETAATQMATNQNFANIVNRTLEMYNNNTLDAAKVQRVMGEEADNYNKRLAASGTATTEFAIGVAAQNKKLTELGQAQDAFTQMVDRFSTEGVKRAQEDAKNQRTTSDKLTDSFAEAQKQAQDFALALQDGILPMIKDFATVSKRMLEEVNKMLDDVKGEIAKGNAAEAQKKRDEPNGNFWDKNKRSIVKETAGAIGFATGAITTAPAAMTGVGAIATAGGAGLGYVTGKQIGDALNEWFFGKEGKARGGIATGPKSGFVEKLHGTEAVVPLPDGRTIPVTLDSSMLPKQQPEKEEAAPAGGFMGALSGIASTLSKAGTVLKDTFVINDKELGAAFAKNKLSEKEIQDLLKLQTPKKAEPDAFESVLNTVSSTFRNLTRSFVSAKDEPKVARDPELTNLTKQVAKRVDTKEAPKEPAKVEVPKTVELASRDSAKLAKISEAKPNIDLSEKSIAETKNAQLAAITPFMTKLNDVVKADKPAVMADNLTRGGKDAGNVDQMVTSLTGEMRKMATTAAASRIEIKDLESLSQLSAKSITEAIGRKPTDPGAENCSALIARYVEQNKKETDTSLGKNFEAVSKQLTGSLDKNKPTATDSTIARSLKDLPSANADVSRSIDETNSRISSGLNDYKAELTAALRDLVNEIRDSMRQTESPIEQMPVAPTATPEEMIAAIRTAILSGNDSLKEALNSQVDIMKANLDKIDQLISISSETKGINQQMLNNSY